MISNVVLYENDLQIAYKTSGKKVNNTNGIFFSKFLQESYTNI